MKWFTTNPSGSGGSSAIRGLQWLGFSLRRPTRRASHAPPLPLLVAGRSPLGCAGAEGVVEDPRPRVVELPVLPFEALQGRERLDGAERRGRLHDEVAGIVVQAREQHGQGARVATAGKAEECLAGGVPVRVIEPGRQRV